MRTSNSRPQRWPTLLRWSPQVGLLLLVTVTEAGCRPADVAQASASKEDTGRPVGQLPVSTVSLQLWPQVVQVQGSMVCDERAVLGAKVAGRVKSVDKCFELGTPVPQGQELMMLEPEDFELRVREAEAREEEVRARLGLKPGESETRLDRNRVPAVLQEEAVRNEAKLAVDRARTLLEGSATSLEEFQGHEAALRVAEAKRDSALNQVDADLALLSLRRAELALAKQAQADSIVRAPFDGIIEHRHVAPGTYLQVGEPVAALVRTDPLRFHGGVPEREALRVREGLNATLEIEGQAARLPVRVNRISPALDPSNRSLTVQMDVPNPGLKLRAGLFAKADIVVDPQAKVLAVPAAAVTEFAGVEKVWLVRDGKLEERRVETGRRNEKWIEIRSGVAAGDTIVADATAK